MKLSLLFKSTFALIVSAFLVSGVFAQTGVSINSSGTPPDADAVLDVSASDKGVLLPRVTDHTALTPNPGGDYGLLVFDTTSNSYWYWSGTAWVEILVGDDQTLAEVLAQGNSAGANGINMNNQAITNIDWANSDDGTGSLLDADLLDGQEGTYYLDADNGSYDGGTTLPSSTVEAAIDALDNAVDGITATNGLTEAPTGVIKLGGALTENTTVNGGAFDMDFTTTDVDGFSIDGTTFSVDGTNNRIGIGTATPSQPLQINVDNNGLNIPLLLRNEDGTQGGNMVGMGFINEANGDWAKAAIVHERQGGFGIGDMHFLLDNTADNSAVTLADVKMTILGSGNVGIGTAGPTHQLEIHGTNSAPMRVHSSSSESDIAFTNGANGSWQAGTNDSGNGTNSNQFYIYDSGGAGYVASFQKGTGNVGIGTTSPGQKLEVAGGARITSLAGTGNRVVIANATGTLSTSSSLVGSGLGDNLGNHGATQTLDMNNNTISEVGQINFDSGESILDGTDMRFSSNSGYMDFRPTDGDHGLILRDFDGSGTAWSGIRTQDDGAMELRADGGTYSQLVLADNGNVGVGTSTPGAKLHVDNGTNTNVLVESDNTGASTLSLHGPSGGQGTGRLYVGQSSAYGGGIEYNGDNSPTTTGAGADYITLYRRNNGTDTWTARNQYNSNVWEFRGLRTNKTYRYYTRTTTSTSDVSLGNWDFCALAGVYFHHSDDNGDDTKQNCRIYSWSEVSAYTARGNVSNSYDWTKNYSANNAWWMYLDNSSDTGDRVTCDAVCIDFE